MPKKLENLSICCDYVYYEDIEPALKYLPILTCQIMFTKTVTLYVKFLNHGKNKCQHIKWTMNRSSSLANMTNIRKYSNRNTCKKAIRETQIQEMAMFNMN